MLRHDNAFAPKGAAFDEPWQAQVLALADSMVQAGHFSASDWAEALGAALREAERAGEPDTGTTYYTAAIAALERLAATRAGIAENDQLQRKHAWEEAYEHTPHGRPVVLGAGGGLGLVMPGVILFTENFEACVRFYRDQLGLPVWFEKAGLVCLRFGTCYLMIETGGLGAAEVKTRAQNPAVLRFNVADLDQAAAFLRAQAITVEQLDFDWGRIGQFRDPDGNLCELSAGGGGFGSG